MNYIYIYIYMCVCVCVTGMKQGSEKRQRGLESPSFSVYLVWMPADAQTNYGISSVHAQWFSH